MESLSAYLTDKLISYGAANIEKRDRYIGGMNLILSDIISFFLILAAGIITHTIAYSMLYQFMLIFIRKFSGGFHAKTYWRCRMTTVGTYVLIYAAFRLSTQFRQGLAVIFCVFAIVTMAICAPVCPPQKILTKTEEKINHALAVVSTSVFSAISLILCFKGIEAGFVIALIILAISILMYVGIIANKMIGGEK